MAEPEADPKPQLQPQDSNPYMHYLHGKKLRPDMVEALTGPLVRPFDETKTYFPVFANVMVPEDVQQVFFYSLTHFKLTHSVPSRP